MPLQGRQSKAYSSAHRWSFPPHANPIRFVSWLLSSIVEICRGTFPSRSIPGKAAMVRREYGDRDGDTPSSFAKRLLCSGISSNGSPSSGAFHRAEADAEFWLLHQGRAGKKRLAGISR